MLEHGKCSCGWNSCFKRFFCISQYVQFYSYYSHLFKLPCTLRSSVFSPQVAEAAVSFFPRERRRGREGFFTVLPVIHADGNDLWQAISTQEKPCIVRTALCQIEQGVADGRCGFTDNVRLRDRLRKYWDQIRQNFSSYKSEERQATPLLTSADCVGVLQDFTAPIITYKSAVCSHNRHGFKPALYPHNLG